MRIQWQKIILLLLFIILGLNTSSGICYLIAWIILLTSASYILCGNTKINITNNADFIPFYILLVWIYGIIRGYFNDNKHEYILANFAGMSCYLTYYVFILMNISKEKIRKLLQISAISASAICCIYFTLDTLGINNDILETILGDVNRGSSTGQSRIYFTGLTVAYSSWTVLLFRVLSTRKERSLLKGRASIWQQAILFSFFTFSLFFATASKGFMLGGICLLSIVLIELHGNKLRHMKLTTNIIGVIIFLTVIIIALINLGYSNIITSMFDNDDTSNEIRYLQLSYIINDISFWGKGLGAIIPNYSRDINAEYGFELSYVNIIHKFGILSLILFISWGYIFYKSTKNIYQRINLLNSLYALGSMGYLFPSIGNPLVMHPACVILNCISIYLLRERKIIYL